MDTWIGLCSLLTLIRLTTAARKHTHAKITLIVSWRSCFMAFANANCHFRLGFDTFLSTVDTPWYYPIRTLTVRTQHGHRCFALCTAVVHTAHAIYIHHFHLFNRLNYILWSRKHRFQREICCLKISVIVWHSIAIAHMPLHGNRNSHRCAIDFVVFIQNIISRILLWDENVEYARNEWMLLQIPIGNRTVHLYLCVNSMNYIFALIGRSTHTIKIYQSVCVCAYTIRSIGNRCVF